MRMYVIAREYLKKKCWFSHVRLYIYSIENIYSARKLEEVKKKKKKEKTVA